MNRDWIKPGVWGFVGGSVVTMIVGFAWGGWTTGGTAERMAMERADAAVTAALVPVCLEKSKADPAVATKVGALKALNTTYERRDAVLKDGWASIAGGEPNGEVAEACAIELLRVAAK
jgi:hypothetical protein